MRFYKEIKYIVSLLLFILVSSTAWAQKKANQNVILILDASGSMWGTINGKAKIDIARSAVSNILKTWNSRSKIGLMAYGHRRKGDCTDIQTLIPVGKANPGQVMAMLKNVNPKGKTPLSESIRIAASRLKSKEDAATVILVSDGLETCGMDPCAVAKQLKKDNINFRAHVVGFDVAKIGDVSRLKCIAQNTGGKFITANNTDELNKALDEVKQAAVKKVVVKTVKVNTYENYQLPAKCKKKRTMFLRSKTKISGIESCMKIIVKSGGDLTISGIMSDSIYIIENGGKVQTSGNQSSVDVYIRPGGELKNSAAWIRNIENDGGNIVNISGDIKQYRQKSGIATMHNVDIELFEMDGGKFTMHKGDLSSMAARGGVIRISTAVKVDKQSGDASVELIPASTK